MYKIISHFSYSRAAKIIAVIAFIGIVIVIDKFMYRISAEIVNRRDANEISALINAVMTSKANPSIDYIIDKKYYLHGYSCIFDNNKIVYTNKEKPCVVTLNIAPAYGCAFWYYGRKCMGVFFPFAVFDNKILFNEITDIIKHPCKYYAIHKGLSNQLKFKLLKYIPIKYGCNGDDATIKWRINISSAYHDRSKYLLNRKYWSKNKVIWKYKTITNDITS